MGAESHKYRQGYLQSQKDRRGVRHKTHEMEQTGTRRLRLDEDRQRTPTQLAAPHQEIPRHGLYSLGSLVEDAHHITFDRPRYHTNGLDWRHLGLEGPWQTNMERRGLGGAMGWSGKLFQLSVYSACRPICLTISVFLFRLFLPQPTRALLDHYHVLAPLLLP